MSTGGGSAPLRALVAALVILGLAGALVHRAEPEPASSVYRDPGVLVLLAALGLLLGTLYSHHPRLTADGVDHFVYLRSLWIDHDLDLADDYEAVSPRHEAGEMPTATGRKGNWHPVGPAVVWTPFYLLADVLCRATGRVPDGQNAVYRNAVATASLLYGWLGLVLLYRAAAPRAGRGPAILAALGIGFGTFLYWYLAFDPAMAHAPAFGAAALVVWLWLAPLPPGPRRAALLGAACGLAALLRWQNALVAMLPLSDALPRLIHRDQWPALVREGLAFGLAAVVVFSPQMMVWNVLYGSFVTIPQGASYLTGAPEIGGVLFAPRHGLLSWSPLLYLGLAGLLILLRREPIHALACIGLFAVTTRVNAGITDWWGGSAFGARRFDGVLPVLGLGLALSLAGLYRLGRRHPLAPVALLLAAFVAWNQLMVAQYRSGTWDYSESVPFDEMGRGAVSVVDRTLGSPFSFPGALWSWLRTGRPLADYESLFMERPHARWSARMGLDDRMFLEDGWSEPAELQGATCRYLVGGSAGIVVPLHRPVDYRLGVRVAAAPGAPSALELRVLVNQRPVGVVGVPAAWQDASIEVSAEVLRAGRNFVRLKLPEGTAARAAAVAGIWLEPSRPAEPASADPR